MATVLREQAQGMPVSDERLTVSRHLQEWLEISARPTVRPKTYENYATHIRLHLNPKIGHVPLAKLKPQQVQALLNDLIASGLSPSTVLRVRATLRRALNQAMRWGRVGRNVATLIDPPKARKYRVEPTSAAEALAILDAVAPHRLAALWTLMLAAGLRLGEALGLQWQDVDLEAGRVTVRQALQRVGGHLILVEPKSETARRTVPLAGFAQTALRLHRAQQLRERLVAGDQWEDGGFVFASPLGRPIDHANALKMFHRLLRAAGLPERRNHDLRHACATLLLAKGTNMRVVMEVLGHSQISLTMNTYTHVVPTLMADAMKGMDELLGEGRHRPGS